MTESQKNWHDGRNLKKKTYHEQVSLPQAQVTPHLQSEYWHCVSLACSTASQRTEPQPQESPQPQRVPELVQPQSAHLEQRRELLSTEEAMKNCDVTDDS